MKSTNRSMWTLAGFALLGMLLTTFYPAGGNSLFFLPKEALHALRGLLFLSGVTCLVISSVKVVTSTDALIEEHGIYFSQKALRKMNEKSISGRELKEALQFGKRAQVGNMGRYIWESDKGKILVVYTDPERNIRDIVT